jgi:uncharacterized membrane protein
VADDPVDPIAEPARAAPPGAGTGPAAARRPLRSAELTTAMAHLYRGEVQRSNTWRTRLDSTTNWAVITTGAGISFALSDAAHHHAVLLLNALLVTLFLWIEARRYRYYELWSYRVRLMEIDYFAALLVPPFAPRSDWAEPLAASLVTPRFPVGMWEAFGRRCRRNYVWLFVVLDLAWAIKALVHPAAAASWPQFVDRFALGPLSGPAMLALVLGYTCLLLGIALATAGLRGARGEVLAEFGGSYLIGRLWRR